MPTDDTHSDLGPPTPTRNWENAAQICPLANLMEAIPHFMAGKFCQVSSWQKLTSITIFHAILPNVATQEEIIHCHYQPDIEQEYKTGLTFKTVSRGWRYSLKIKSSCCSSRREVQFLILISSSSGGGGVHEYQHSHSPTSCSSLPRGGVGGGVPEHLHSHPYPAAPGSPWTPAVTHIYLKIVK